MGDDEAVAGEAGLGKARIVEGEGAEGIHQLGIATRRHGEDELQRAPALLGQIGQCADVVEAQEASVGHQNDALDGKALQDGRQHGLQGLRLGDVAGVDGVHERQAIGRLHDAEHELSGDAADLLVHAVGAEVVLDRAFAMDPDCCEVVEDDGQIAVDQRADLFGELSLDLVSPIHQRVHRAQQMLVCDPLRHCRQCHGVQPAQAAEL